MGVGVGGVGWSVDPAVDEFDEDEGARPDGGSDVHGEVVLVERECGSGTGSSIIGESVN